MVKGEGYLKRLPLVARRAVEAHQLAVERKQAEEALRQSEENFRRSLNDSPLGVRIITQEGETVYANRAILDIYGYDNIEELRTTPAKKRYTPESYAEFQIRREKRQRGEYTPSEYEISIMRKSGEVRHLQVFRKEVLWDGERQFQGMYQDITEHKRAVEELMRSRERMTALAGRLQAVREEERANVARTIHDEIGQAITGINMDIAWLMRQMAGKAEISRDKTMTRLKSMADSAHAMIDLTRTIITDLRPSMLDDLGLIAAMEWQIQDFGKKTGIECELVSSVEELALDKERTTALFRIFQEALANVSRHARATKIVVGLHIEGGAVILEVTDNGRGITEGESSGVKTYGLLGMRERALAFGGAVEIAGALGKGTTVRVTMPVL